MSISAMAQEKVELYHTTEEKRDVANIHLDGISIGSLIEVEASAGSDAGEDISDVVLATFELGLEAELAEGITARALLLWEEDDTEPVDLDEAVITLGGTEDIPVYIEGGKMYVPFGVFHSHFVSDPLVLELAETRESAVAAGYANDLVDAKVGIFNGSLDEDGDDDQGDDLVASITLTPADGIEIGAYWIADIGESDVLEEGLAAAVEGDEVTDGVAYREVGGAGGYLHAEAGAFMFEAEYVTALDGFETGLMGETELEPMAWNTELAFTATETLEFAVKAEGTEDFPEMPENQYGIAGSYALAENATVTVEYLHGTYAGGVDDRDLVTGQFAVEL